MPENITQELRDFWDADIRGPDFVWRTGDQVKVDDYLDSRGLKRNALFNQLLQALIELAPTGSDERSMLESLSNHVAARERVGAPRQAQLVL